MCGAAASGPGSCFRCGVKFDEGALRYRVDIRVAADTGGEATIEDVEKELAHLLKVIEGRSEEELEREVHQDYRFYLCGPCREDYLKGPEIPLGTFFFGT
ncbi:MAG: hypothetical protein HZA22_09280 [Nitrospirae bacterium]|nr:hypothetical protein [Nitrospirota bacterium]MBI5696789.1 hypothetical protein [Nitrospirota bacterium]